MLDIKLIRSNPDLVKANIKKREMNLDSTVDEILDLDVKRRELIAQADQMKAQQNAESKKIPQVKKEGGDVSALMAAMKDLSAKIKEIDEKKHILLTGKTNRYVLEGLRYLSDIQKPVWIRHVLVPGYTDFDEDLRELRAFIDTLDNVQRVEVLPYHDLAKPKYAKLSIPYPLADVLPPTKDRVENAKRILKAF